MKAPHSQSGFTIVELLIIILVIGVLASLVFVSFHDIRRGERDKDRQYNVKILHNSMESYFANTGKYPTLADINSADWRTSNMKSLESDALQDPSSKTAALVAAPTKGAYSYQVKASDDTDCDNTTKDCAKYTLTATLERGGTYTKSNLN